MTTLQISLESCDGCVRAMAHLSSLFGPRSAFKRRVVELDPQGILNLDSEPQFRQLGLLTQEHP